MTAAVSAATKVAKGAGAKAATATKGTGGKAGTAGAGSRVQQGARAGSTAAQQRAGIQAIKDARVPAAPAEPAAAEPAADQPAQTAASRQLPAAPAAVGAGSGFLLGVFTWALGLAYLQGGSTGVKRFLNAKFLNKT